MTSRSIPPLRPATLAPWGDGPPRSARYGDVYHAADGVAEVQRVFMAPAALEARFEALRSTFTIGELGFGTGLNFAVIARAFLRTAPRESRLHFVSIEKHPLNHDDFAHLARWRARELASYRSLAAHPLPLLAGWHRRHLNDGRITLSVFYGDVDDGLVDLTTRMRRPVDHWLLDGFAPARNPEMWKAELFVRAAQLSGRGATACTFSAAGVVRRGLTAAGFRVTRVDQRPHKRHSVLAELDRPQHTFTAPRAVHVIGAGLAGSCTARALAERGLDVTLVDDPARPPVTLPTATANPRLLADPTPEGRFRMRSFHFSAAWLARFDGVRRTGVLRLATDGDSLARIETIWDRYRASGPWLQRVDPGSASSISGLPLTTGGLLLPDAVTVDVGTLLTALTDHPRITRAATTSAGEQHPTILCTGPSMGQTRESRYLELRAVWGQLELLDIDRGPRLPLTGAGVVTPGSACYGVGSTYEQVQWPPDRARRFNLERFEAWWAASVAAPLRYRPLGHMRGCRCVSSDRIPVIGPLHDADGHVLPQRFVSTAHGSHGTLTAPLAADCLAAHIDGEFPILDAAEAACVDGARFLRRQARRGVRTGAR